MRCFDARKLCRVFQEQAHGEESLKEEINVTLSALAGLPLSVETAPHYLVFNEQDVADGNTLLKCAPPIRDATNQAALSQGLKVINPTVCQQ